MAVTRATSSPPGVKGGRGGGIGGAGGEGGGVDGDGKAGGAGGGEGGCHWHVMLCMPHRTYVRTWSPKPLKMKPGLVGLEQAPSSQKAQ